MKKKRKGKHKLSGLITKCDQLTIGAVLEENKLKLVVYLKCKNEQQPQMMSRGGGRCAKLTNEAGKKVQETHSLKHWRQKICVRISADCLFWLDDWKLVSCSCQSIVDFSPFFVCYFLLFFVHVSGWRIGWDNVSLMRISRFFVAFARVNRFARIHQMGQVLCWLCHFIMLCIIGFVSIRFVCFV